MEFSQQELDQITDYSRQGYTAGAIAIMLDYDVEEFHVYLCNPEGELAKAFNEGITERESEVYESVLNNAKKGDAESVKLINEIDKQRKIDELKKELFNV